MTHHSHGSRHWPPLANGSAHRMARGLGWFSIGLGLVELLAPHQVSRFLGMDGHERLIRLYGLREIGAGLGILTQEDPTPWVWGRVAGDALDIATLVPWLGADNPQQANAGMALAAVAGATAMDVGCAMSLSAPEEPRVVYDYSGRSGLPRPPEMMRGAARDIDVPRDMRTPEALRPYGVS